MPHLREAHLYALCRLGELGMPVTRALDALLKGKGNGPCDWRTSFTSSMYSKCWMET